MSTTVEFRWFRGIALEPLLKGLEKYAVSQGLSLTGKNGRNPRYSPPLGEQPYRISWSTGHQAHCEETRDPWASEPLAKPAFRRLAWEFFSSTESEWFWCNIFWSPEEDAAYPHLSRKCIDEGKVIRLLMSFDEEISSRSLSVEQVGRSTKKYQQLKELFELLDADVVCAWADRFWGGYETEKDDPNFDHQIFRFAKKGRQFLFRPFEEGRAPQLGESDEALRIVVEPSGK